MKTKKANQPDPPSDRLVELVKGVAANLEEHFDTVQIFVSKFQSNQEGTVNIVHGGGNWFARYGQIKNWINKEDAPDHS